MLECERVYVAESGSWSLEHVSSSWALAQGSSLEPEDFDGSVQFRPHLMRTLRAWLTVPKGWHYENLLTADRSTLISWLPALDPGRHKIDAEAFRGLAQRFSTPRSTPYDWTGGVMIPIAIQQVSRAAERQCAVDEALIACALERHRLAKHAYPVSLDALMPTYIAKVPCDVTTGQPLHYHPNAEGSFNLYSVGWDGKDDGGKVAIITTDGNTHQDLDHGDWAWPQPVK
jgi:hypothetical protein